MFPLFECLLFGSPLYNEQHRRAGQNTQQVFTSSTQELVRIHNRYLRAAHKSWSEYTTFDKVKELLYFLNKYNPTINIKTFRTLPFPAMISLLAILESTKLFYKNDHYNQNKGPTTGDLVVSGYVHISSPTLLQMTRKTLTWLATKQYLTPPLGKWDRFGRSKPDCRINKNHETKNITVQIWIKN